MRANPERIHPIGRSEYQIICIQKCLKYSLI